MVLSLGDSDPVQSGGHLGQTVCGDDRRGQCHHDRPVAKSVPLMESLTKLQFLRGNELSFSRRLHAIR
jgi:hypothetical protein